MNLEIEIYGVAAEVTPLHKVQVVLPDSAGTKDVLAALMSEIPELVGTVSNSKSGGLIAGYTLNIDGRYFSGSENKKLAGGEHIVLLALASGG
jgi:hypothetical protein